jgi:hypothetical protein
MNEDNVYKLDRADTPSSYHLIRLPGRRHS